MNSLIARRQAIINADGRKLPRKWGNVNGDIRPVAAKAGKRPQVGRESRMFLSQFTPHVELRGKAKTERNWFNDPREVFIG